MMSIRRRIAVIVVLFLCSTGALSAPARKASIVLTSQENRTVPQSEFLCAGEIHGYLVLPQRQEGMHRLEGIWKLPNGRIAEDARINLNFTPPGRSTAYLWLA